MKKETSVKLKHVVAFAMICVCSLGMTGCGSGASDLPPHVVADNSSLAPKDGRRIQLNSNSPELTKEQRTALIDGYRRKAGLEGQGSVHKPSKMLKGTMAPWCVENFDGHGIVFNDNMF